MMLVTQLPQRRRIIVSVFVVRVLLPPPFAGDVPTPRASPAVTATTSDVCGRERGVVFLISFPFYVQLAFAFDGHGCPRRRRGAAIIS